MTEKMTLMDLLDWRNLVLGEKSISVLRCWALEMQQRATLLWANEIKKILMIPKCFLADGVEDVCVSLTENTICFIRPP